MSPDSVKARRAEWASEASHSALLEGLTVSEACIADSNDYVAGVITADELVELTRERFGLVGR
ncbi:MULTISPECIES: antitoxin VbhA family protein [unclassified Leucobacter]|uniref:antitoxin VbhA family protein n=1 Tax=unclassified Leucobacter TaxID=2621730 RepID=UPI001BFD79E6|nr:MULTISPECIES: antitoxin VbhA family protein [unclassified Leucobacter]